MTGRKVTIKRNLNLHDLGVVEKVEYPEISFESVYHDNTLRPATFEKKTIRTKPVTVFLRVFKKNVDEVRKEIDKIKGLSFSDEPFEFNLDNKKFCLAILEGLDKEEMRDTGLVVFHFTNLDGLWYSEEKSSRVRSVTNSGMRYTNNFKIILNPTGLNPVIKDGRGNKIEISLSGLSQVVVDFEKKTVTQNSRHVPISIDSKFFILAQGINTITVENATFEIKYREVVSL